MPETLLQKLKEYDKTMLPMHMPGHKRNLALSGKDGYLSALCADCDITEIAGFDNLAEPEEVLLSLKERAAKLWKSEEAYPLVNGSTCGILAAIYATVSANDKVLMARNCHKSVYNGVRIVNAKVAYLQPERETETGACGAVTPETVEAALQKNKDTKLIIVTSPTYEGMVSDVEGICRVAHSYGVPVLVDSAHGAHFGFGRFPKGAVECGADLVVHSLHKTLPCLTQTAILHRSGNLIAGEAVQTAVNMFQTSSPSYLLLASVEGCIGLLEERGDALCGEWKEALEEFYRGAGLLQHIRVIGDEKTTGDYKRGTAVYDRDPGKLVILTRGTEMTGPQLMDRLRETYRIELEMAAEQYGLAMTGAGDTKGSLARLLQALLDIDAQCGKGEVCESFYPSLPPVRMRVADAEQLFKKEYRWEDAVGRIAGEYVWAYPPGVPLLVPGEEITEELICFLMRKEASGVRIHRTGGGNQEAIRCIEREGTL
ncbi:MAG: aminotransferase class I/II-fold pyridoxal phosphate-dependent enzyme [Lachnospiraceae bacterium]|nr:aminotransferase class I/II-fold pyridoxal phosphate-dependent enzyme [Lachnospiraceae bacterium]